MENFSRINFWIVILYVCWKANAFPVDSNIDLMLTDVKCENDSKFYTPENVRSNCIIEALECIKAELQNIRKECEDPEEVINTAEEFLTDTIQRQKVAVKGKESNSTKCVCESWPEKPFTGFMEGMKDLVERIQSAD